MKFVCLADTHNKHHQLKVPDGDVLLHAGDFCQQGTLAEVAHFADWLAGQPHRHKVIIAGNHDIPLERQAQEAESMLAPFHYLQDTEITLDSLRIYGSPWQPWFHDWAFNLPRGARILAKWRQIPAKVDILLTHGPLYGIGDTTCTGEQVGCQDLYQQVSQRIKPRYHICGHIHEGRGRYRVLDTISINASCLDGNYAPVQQQPFTFEI